MMKLIALGSGGGTPSKSRHTASYLIDTGESIVILDAGSGLARLGDYSTMLKKYEEVNIILSHYHLDHIIGISYLSNWNQAIKKLNIYGPGKDLGFETCRKTLSDIFTPPYYVDLDKVLNEVNMLDYNLQGFKIGNMKISINEQVHSGRSFGVTVGNYIHYATDTAILEETFALAQNVKLLLHDCWDKINIDSKDHSSFEQIKLMLNKYRIQKVGLIHIHPIWKDVDFKELMISLVNNQNIEFVDDKWVVELSD
ncbi:MBL fold metallo-hydrolase [Pseudoneobacillus rhizosphaerae]|uniref:Ribonuclease BN n=1 Tax=Pseudoneobacillus rhizosphaerae TaxID=2880968 RepID=A0A9C7G787_9BACI|nr:MBL fold metallo-hydrolase [Pseudoneobacillus rhizosphaerae]CAG9606955.1 Ribonuclease BN [Pseudoneobacillus rhizosphaerae]